MNIKIEDDLRELSDRLNVFNDSMLKVLASTKEQAANIVRNHSIQNIQSGTRTGIKYLVSTSSSGRRTIRRADDVVDAPSGSFLHQASAIGEYPKTLDGGLTASIQISKNNDFEWNVGTNLNYGVKFEENNRSFLNRALEESREKIEEVFFNNIKSEVER